MVDRYLFNAGEVGGHGHRSENRGWENSVFRDRLVELLCRNGEEGCAKLCVLEKERVVLVKLRRTLGHRFRRRLGRAGGFLCVEGDNHVTDAFGHAFSKVSCCE